MIAALFFAAAVSVRPVASRPLFIPFVTHRCAKLGTIVSEVRLFNGGTRDETVTLVFTPDGGDGTTTFKSIDVPVSSHQIVALRDIVATSFSTTGTGSLQLAGDIPDIIATSRTSLLTGNGTLGDSLRAVEQGTQDAAVVLPARANSRSTIGFTEMAGRPGTIRIALLGADKRLLSTTDLRLEPLSHADVDVGDGDASEAAASVVDGEARITLFATVTDDVSGDIMFVVPNGAGPGPDTGDAPVISASGAGGRQWRSDLILSSCVDPACTGAAIQTTFHDEQNGDDAGGYVLLGPAVEFTDVVSSMFDRHNTLGTLQVGGHGAWSYALRVYATLPDGGTIGQFVPFTYLQNTHNAPLSAGSGPRQLIFIDDNDVYRTNVGATVRGTANLPADPQTARLRFTAFDAAGNVLGATERTIQAPRMVQFPLSSIIRSPLTAGRVEVEMIEGTSTATATAWASVIDRKSGDPTYVPLQ